MDYFDIILLNIISYMSGVFTGILIYYKTNYKNKYKNKDNDEKLETDFDNNIDKYHSPNFASLPSAPAFHVSSQPLNPEYKKKITVTTE